MQFEQQKKQLLFFLFLFISFVGFAQTDAYKNNKISAYTEHFISNSKELKTDSNQRASRKRELKDNQNELKEISAYIELEEDCGLSLLSNFGIKTNSVVDNIITASIPLEIIEELAGLKEVKRIEIGIPVQVRMDEARKSTRVNKVQAEQINETSYTGKGVIIGIVDMGFDFNHFNFKDKDGNLRIKRVWDQDRKYGGEKPENYDYGVEFKTEQEIIKAKYDYISNYSATHGTHVLGIASGSDKTNDNNFFGVAPEAEIVLVSLKDDGWKSRPTNVSISDAIKYIYDYADSVNKPCVVNLSLGSHFGPHDGSSIFDRLADKMQGEGRLLVGAAGNEGYKSFHVSKNILNKQDTLKTLFDIPEKKGSILEIWGEENKTFSIQIFTYNKQNGELKDISEDIAVTENEKKTISIDIDGFKGVISLLPSGNKNDINSRYNVMLFSNFSKIPDTHRIGMKIFNTTGNVHAWFAQDGQFTNENKQGWSTINKEYSVGEIGGTGKRIISVGAYITKKTFKNIEGKTYAIPFGEIEEIAPFSSVGPTLDGRIKPEITAPGATIAASFSGHHKVISNSDHKKHLVKQTTIGENNYYYGTMDGTSMAAPHVTGILALWLEANNKLSPEVVKDILKKTAKKDDYTTEHENNEWGYGKIDAYAGIVESLRLKETDTELDIKKTKKDTWAKFNFLDNNNRTIEIKRNVEQIEIKIWTVDGKAVWLKEIKPEKNMESNIVNLPSLSRGIYIVKIQAKGKKDIVFKFII